MLKKLYSSIIILLLICSIFLTAETSLSYAETVSSPIFFSLTDSGFNPKEITIEKGKVIIIKNDGTKLHFPELSTSWFHNISPVEALPQDTQWVSQPLITGEWMIKDKLYPAQTAILKVVENPNSKTTIITNPKFPTGVNIFDWASEWFQNLFTRLFSKA